MSQQPNYDIPVTSLWCSISQKLAHCLAVLPKSKGDEESWSLMIQKVLLSINRHLNDVFQGFEEGTMCYDVGVFAFAVLDVSYQYP